MSKISDYSPKTVFNDDDLYDCSTKNGAIYETESATFLDLKNAITDGLIPAGLTKLDIVIGNHGAGSNGSFDVINTLSGKFGYYQTGKILHLFLFIECGFPSGLTGGKLQIDLPSLPTTVDNDFAYGANGAAHNLSVGGYTAVGTTGDISNLRDMVSQYHYLSSDRIYVQAGWTNTAVDNVKFNIQGTIPLL